MNYLKIIVAYFLVVFLLSIIPTGFGPSLNKVTVLTFRADYLLHALVFLPWMILVWLHLNKEELTGSKRNRQMLLWFLAGLLLATFSEGIHYLLPYRSFNPMDLIYNISGVVGGIFIFFWKPASSEEEKVVQAR